MAKATKKKASGEKLLTLSEVSKQTGISMPSCQRYKKLYQNRIPAVGKGRKQRYPVEALEVFHQIKQENISRRGRPRKSAKPAATRKRKAGGTKRKTAAQPAKKAAAGGLLTLTEISKRTGISYPTLVRYVKLHGDKIPHEGEGRKRRFHPEAVEVFRKLRAESPRGRRKKGAAAPAAGRARPAEAGLGRRVQALERTQARLEKEIRALVKGLQKPITVTLRRR